MILRIETLISNVLISQKCKCVPVCYSVLQGATGWCRLLQCVAVCCSVMQCEAARCGVLQRVPWSQVGESRCTVRCSALQCVAVCCSVLQ